MSLFIVLEGLDGAGTTTQTQLLSKNLKTLSQQVHITCEPSTGEIGKLARRYLSGELTSTPDLMALVFAADRIDHISSEVAPKLDSGVNVISDRYVHSSLVYQGEDLNDGFSTTWVESLNARARVADITFFIHVPVAVSLQRIDTRAAKDIYESEEQLKMMEKRYAHVMKALASRGDNIITIDGTQTISAIEEIIFSEVQKLIS